MTKTAKLAYAKFKRGLLIVILSGLLASAPQNAAVAQTISLSPETVQALIGPASPEQPVPVEPPSIQDRLLAVCQDRGYGEDCARTLLGMAWKESQFVPTAVGDNGRARGWFQIHYRLHKISLDCAQDLVCSANWTISYMERNGYPKYPKYAVQCHNGCGIANGYAASALRHGQRLWNDESKQVAVR